MNRQCPCCGELFEKEPGYYTGAMYVSYAYYTALIVGSFLLFEVILTLDTYAVIGGLVGLIVLLTPVVFRLARLTWINFFISFDPQKQTSCP
ncbi:DUF983 domain-containing protein [Larkinella insperata]|uniref:DUF983 domain-containing protein n=1 Tax=Larkinella insperata TaxID=332158 RepID=A0ABW3Q196_9BACT